MTCPDSEFKPGEPDWVLPSKRGTAQNRLLRYAKRVLIPKVEELYGETHPGCRLESIKFHKCGPQTRLPDPSSGGFKIWLNPKCNTKTKPVSYRAVYQLAHECVHALKPVELGKASVLEEGLAVKNSIRPNEQEFRKWVFDYEPGKGSRTEMYARAYEAVECLGDDLESFVRDFRSANPRKGISDIKIADLRCAVGNAQLKKAQRHAPLTRKFEKWANSLD